MYCHVTYKCFFVYVCMRGGGEGFVFMGVSYYLSRLVCPTMSGPSRVHWCLCFESKCTVQMHDFYLFFLFITLALELLNRRHESMWRSKCIYINLHTKLCILLVIYNLLWVVMCMMYFANRTTLTIINKLSSLQTLLQCFCIGVNITKLSIYGVRVLMRVWTAKNMKCCPKV